MKVINATTNRKTLSFNDTGVSIKREIPKTWNIHAENRALAGKKRSDAEIWEKTKLTMLNRGELLDFLDSNSKNVRYRRDLVKSLKKRGVFVPVYLPSGRKGWLHSLKAVSFLLNIIKDNFQYLYTKNKSVLTPQDIEVLEMVAKLMGIDTSKVKKKRLAYWED